MYGRTYFFNRKKIDQCLKLEGVKAVTIDQIGIEVHDRYAKDQEKLKKIDSFFIKDAAPHFETTGTSSIFTSEWEKLFSFFSDRNHTWAQFADAPNFSLPGRRSFFSFALVPSLEGFSQEEESGERVYFAEERERLSSVKIPHHALAHLERERSQLFNLLDKIGEFNELLQQIHSNRIGTQRG